VDTGEGWGEGVSERAYLIRMFDLGRSFIASVERSPRSLAIVDGDRRLTYAE